MKTVELFAGTGSFSNVAKILGHETYTVEIDEEFHPDCVYDLSTPLSEEIKKKIYHADIIWMSPPCTTFSMASGNKHWTADRKPRTMEAKIGKDLLHLCSNIAMICILNKGVFFIENPRARARWFLPEEWRKTAWYCQYGDNRAKPTDIWSNLDEWNPKTCKNGNKDCHHEAAPRGSKTGTQGLKTTKERSVVPKALIEEIFEFIDKRKKDLYKRL